MHLWRGKEDAAVEMMRTLLALLCDKIKVLLRIYRQCAETAHDAATTVLSFLVNNRKDLVDYECARMSGRRISSASADSVMNRVVNRRMSKNPQMRWSIKGAHCLLQTRIDLLDGRLEGHFAARFLHFRPSKLQFK